MAVELIFALMLYSPPRPEPDPDPLWRACGDAPAKESIEACTTIINAKPATDGALGGAYYLRALSHARLQQYDQAIADAGQAMRLRPRMIEPYFVRGGSYLWTADYERAILDLERAVEMKNEHPGAFYTDSHGEFVAYPDVGSRPWYPESLTWRGTAYLGRGKIKGRPQDARRSIKDFDKAIKVRRDHAPAYCYRADAYNFLGDPKRAIADAEISIKLDPKDPCAYQVRGEAKVKLGDEAGGKADMALAAQVDAARR